MSLFAVIIRLCCVLETVLSFTQFLAFHTLILYNIELYTLYVRFNLLTSAILRRKRRYKYLL